MWQLFQRPRWPCGLSNKSKPSAVAKGEWQRGSSLGGSPGPVRTWRGSPAGQPEAGSEEPRVSPRSAPCYSRKGVSRRPALPRRRRRGLGGAPETGRGRGPSEGLCAPAPSPCRGLPCGHRPARDPQPRPSPRPGCGLHSPGSPSSCSRPETGRVIGHALAVAASVGCTPPPEGASQAHPTVAPWETLAQTVGCPRMTEGPEQRIRLRLDRRGHSR